MQQHMNGTTSAFKLIERLLCVLKKIVDATIVRPPLKSGAIRSHTVSYPWTVGYENGDRYRDWIMT